ncbi:MAG: hypothetical protein V3R31_06045 [Candidatus Humimicrobiaceae bacterium]
MKIYNIGITDTFSTQKDNSSRQTLEGLSRMNVNENLNTRNWHSNIEFQFENHNLSVIPYHEIFINNRKHISIDEGKIFLDIDHDR